jgi:hypothetical protein
MSRAHLSAFRAPSVVRGTHGQASAPAHHVHHDIVIRTFVDHQRCIQAVNDALQLVLWDGPASAPAASTMPPGIEVVYVDTAKQLADALDNGAAHVHITKHLNLTDIPPRDPALADETPWYLTGTATLRSLTVRFWRWV